MKTIIKKLNENEIDPQVIQEAGEIIKRGGLVGFPTETVYGLGANALDEEAAGKIYAAKGRPSDNPLIVHIAEVKDLEEIAVNMPYVTEKLTYHFWPGPLTMIFQKSEKVPYGTTGGLDTVAVRMPSNRIAAELIRAGGGFISAPSANTSGRPSPTTAEHVAEDLSGKIDMILDGGTVDIGLESTILDMTVTPPMILRPGAITREMLQEVLGEVAVDQTILSGDSTEKPKAPGMKYRHYAPEASLTIVDGDVSGESKAIRQLAYPYLCEGKRVGIIATEETKDVYDARCVIKVIGSRDSEESIAKNLYQVLREFDTERVDLIYSESFAVQGIGKAVMNRLEKAAGHRHILAKEVLKEQTYHSIYFISNSDTGRGPMAAKLLGGRELKREYRIYSRGLVVLFPEPVNPKVETILKSNGESIEGYMSRQFDPEELEEDSLILTMDGQQREKVLELCAGRHDVYVLGEFVAMETEVPDPYGGSLKEYGAAYELMEVLIQKLADKLNKE